MLQKSLFSTQKVGIVTLAQVSANIYSGGIQECIFFNSQASIKICQIRVSFFVQLFYAVEDGVAEAVDVHALGGGYEDG